MNRRHGAAVIMPAFGRPHLVERAIRALLPQLEESGSPLILVDDGSDPPLMASLSRHIASNDGVISIRLNANSGRANAINRALNHYHASIYIICDSDVVADSNFVADHLRLHRQSGSARRTFVGQLRVDGDSTSWHKLMGARSSPRMTLGVQPWYLSYTDNWSFAWSQDLPNPLFDPRFKGWGWEDVHLGYRLNSLGYSFELVPAASGIHLSSVTLDSFTTQLARSRRNLSICLSDFPQCDELKALVLTVAPKERDLCAEFVRFLFSKLESALAIGTPESGLRPAATSVYDLASVASLARPLNGAPPNDALSNLRRKAQLDMAILLRAIGDPAGALQVLNGWATT